MSNKSIDFLKVYNKKPELSGSKRNALIFAGAAVVAAGAFAATAFGMNAKLKALDAQCRSEDAYINDAAVQRKYSEYDATLEEYNRELALSGELAESLAAVRSYPTINSALLRSVKSAAGDKVELVSYDYADANGVMRLAGVSKDFSEGANYAARLEGLDRFAGVGYHGYYLEDRTYAFEDECLLNPGNASVSTQR